MKNTIDSFTMLHEGSLCVSSMAVFAITMCSVNHIELKELGVKKTKTFSYILTLKQKKLDHCFTQTFSSSLNAGQSKPRS